MKTAFVEDGPSRFRRSKDTLLWKSIKAEYADQLASASLFKKLRIEYQMQREFLRRRKDGHRPSPGTLW
jgi:hypothetical protein